MMLLLTLCVIFFALSAGSFWLFSAIGQTADDPAASAISIVRRITSGKQSVFVLLLVALSIIILFFTGTKVSLFLSIPLVVLTLSLLATRCVLRIRAHRRRLTLQAELPDSLTQMASSMQAGATLATAMRWYIEESPGPLAQELFIVQYEHRLGAHLEDALHNE